MDLEVVVIPATITPLGAGSLVVGAGWAAGTAGAWLAASSPRVIDFGDGPWTLAAAGDHERSAGFAA